MPEIRDPVHEAFRFLLLDPDPDRGRLIAGRAQAAGHMVALEGDAGAVRDRLIAEPWDAVGIELLAGPLPSSFALRDLQQAARRAGIRMPPTLIYVRGALADRRAVIDGMLDEMVPGVERVISDDPELVVRALVRLAAAVRPTAFPIAPGAGGEPPACAPVPALHGQSAAAPAPDPQASPLQDGSAAPDSN
jgi:hypothetical protein